MAAEPAPASLENAARWKPDDQHADEPAVRGVRPNAPEKIVPNAAGISAAVVEQDDEAAIT
jgi:hypothetical protein